MKKVRNNLKVIVAFVIGIIITGGVAYAANLIASDVTYDNTTSGLQSTTVQGALDELTAKAATAGIDANSIDFATVQTNSVKTVLVSSKGICINRNGKLNCFKINNWNVEKEHVQQVFSDISCGVHDDYVSCYASDFDCRLHDDGHMRCIDNANGYKGCYLETDASINCY